jgi:hypothetical protein
MILMKCAEEARHSSLSRRAAAGLYGISTLGLYQEQFSSSAMIGPSPLPDCALSRARMFQRSLRREIAP